jgi:SAM-dependent methyltransferase
MLIKETYITEILRLEVPVINGWVGGCYYVPNSSRGYHGILKRWWDIFGLKGVGLVIGEREPYAFFVKRRLQEDFPEALPIAVDLSNSDINWDITKPLNKEPFAEWIICQAVLEHVKDPIAAIKNLSAILKKNGLLYFHSHGNDFPYHAYPIDVYRFMKDALIVFAELANLEVLDMLWTPKHCFAVYKKK